MRHGLHEFALISLLQGFKSLSFVLIREIRVSL